MLWPETETNLKILSLRYPKEMFSSFCLIWDFRVNSSQGNLIMNSLFSYKGRLNRSLKSKVAYKAGVQG